MGTGADEDNLVSLSGDPIWIHDKPSSFQAPEGEMCLEEISAHIARHLGPVETVFHELVSDTMHIDVHVVLPSRESACVRLVTSGMSDLPMTIPDHLSAPRHAELMISLPPDWKLDQASFESGEWYWPVRLLKSLARLPHKYATWLDVGHTVPNGDPAVPYASNTRLCGAIIAPPISSDDDFDTLRIDDDKEIRFYSVVPIYQAEMDLKLRKGAGALFERLGAKHVTDLVAITRPDVTKKLFGVF